MRRADLAAALVTIVITVAGCSGSSGGKQGSAPPPSTGATSAALAGCPTNEREVAAVLGEPIKHVEGSINGSTEQLCAFGTDANDPGALGVVFLRFPRPEIGVSTLAQARQRYGAPLAGHTIVSMPSWGEGAFLDDSVLPDRNLVADFAWLPRYELILGMHATDPHAVNRRQLIERLVALTR